MQKGHFDRRDKYSADDVIDFYTDAVRTASANNCQKNCQKKTTHTHLTPFYNRHIASLATQQKSGMG